MMTSAAVPWRRPTQVEDPHLAVLHEVQQKAEGQFAFTTKVAGEYKACFTVRGERPSGWWSGGRGIQGLGAEACMAPHGRMAWGGVSPWGGVSSWGLGGCVWRAWMHSGALGLLPRAEPPARVPCGAGLGCSGSGFEVAGAAPHADVPEVASNPQGK